MIFKVSSGCRGVHQIVLTAVLQVPPSGQPFRFATDTDALIVTGTPRGVRSP